MKDRIEEILAKFQLSSAQFADIIGVQRSSISHLLSGRNKPSFDFIHKILLKYPEINAQWLITGQGKLENPTNHSSLPSNSIDPQDLFTQKPEKEEDNSEVSELIDLVRHVNSNKKELDSTLQNEEVTNVNNVKSIVLIYNDDSFKILTSR